MGVKDVLFSFNGRIPRRTYWLWGIISSFVIMALMGVVAFTFMAGAIAKAAPAPPPPAATSALDSIRESPPAPAAITTPETAPEINPLMFVLLGLLFIPLVWTGFAIQAKRWHDRGKSGWMCLINCVPLLGIWTFVECGCLRGSFGPNQHGQDPT